MTDEQAQQIIILLTSLVEYCDAICSGVGFAVVYAQRIGLALGWLLGVYLFRCFLLSAKQKTIIALLVAMVLPASASGQTEWIVDNGSSRQSTFGSGISTFSTLPNGYYGGSVLLFTSVNSGVTLDFTDMTEGTYTLYLRWCDTCSSFSTNVAHQIMRGDLDGYIITGNHSQAAAPTAHETRGGSPFQSLFTFELPADAGGFYFTLINQVNSTNAKLDAVLLIRHADPGPECEGTIWPGHPSYVGGRPSEWATEFTTRASGGNYIGALDGSIITWTWSDSVGFNIPESNTMGIDQGEFSAGGYISNTGWHLFLVERMDTGPGNFQWVYGHPDHPGQIYSPYCAVFGGTICPVYPPCCGFGVSLAFGLHIESIDSSVCTVTDGNPSAGGCCGATIELLENIRDILQESNEEQPGDGFSEGSHYLRENPLYDVIPTHTLPAISNATKYWEIAFPGQGLGISSEHLTYYWSSSWESVEPYWSEVREYAGLIRLCLLWLLQAGFYGRMIDILREF